jgi:hypothetical protein
VEHFGSLLSDLTERFNRFQNRETMRSARAAKSNSELEQEAADLLSTKSKVNHSEPDPGSAKLDLWGRM